MAAPSTVYLENGAFKVALKEEDLSGNVLATYNNYIPKKLYGTMAQTMELFYLDGIETDINIEDASNNIIESGFVGYCIVGSANYHMHAAARRGRMNASLFDNGEIKLNDRVYFNDGALNVKSKVWFVEVLSDRANDIRIKVNIKIPYHNPDVELRLISTVTRGGVPVTLTSWESPKKIFYNSLSAAQTKEAILGILESNLIFAGDELTFVIQTQNEEGPYEDVAFRQFTVRPVLVTWSYSPYYASYARDYPTTTYNIRSPRFPIYDGTTLYLSDVMGTTAPSGYYADSERWYQLDITGTIIDSGYFGYWPVGDPLNPYPTVAIAHDGVRNNLFNIQAYVEGINYSSGSGWDATVTIYRRISDNKYCTDVAGTNTVINGYYVFPYGGGDASTLLGNRIVVVYRISSGDIIEEWHYDIINNTWEQQL